MRIAELKDAPEWLKYARVDQEDVAIVNGVVVWRDGEWRGGEWRGGEWRGGVWCGGVWCGGEWCDGEWCDGVWCDGEWCGGEWRGGVWRDGVWCGGEWRDGEWCDGVWCGGEWRGGVWRDGEWRGGEWRGGEWRGGVWCGGMWCGGEWRGGEWCDGLIPSRIHYHAALLGIVFDEYDEAVAYRTTEADGTGRITTSFRQQEGIYYEDDVAPAGSGTCTKGIHVTTAARAMTYFGIDPRCQLWRVRFHREDLLDCDGEKARIAGGYFEKIPFPWAKETP